MNPVQVGNKWQIEGLVGEYPTAKAAIKAYHNYKTKALREEYDKFIEENPDIEKLFLEYFGEKAFIARLKTKTLTSFEDMIKDLSGDIVVRLKEKQHLWHYRLERALTLC